MRTADRFHASSRKYPFFFGGHKSVAIGARKKKFSTLSHNEYGNAAAHHHHYYQRSLCEAQKSALWSTAKVYIVIRVEYQWELAKNVEMNFKQPNFWGNRVSLVSLYIVYVRIFFAENDTQSRGCTFLCAVWPSFWPCNFELCGLGLCAGCPRCRAIVYSVECNICYQYFWALVP